MTAYPCKQPKRGADGSAAFLGRSEQSFLSLRVLEAGLQDHAVETHQAIIGIDLLSEGLAAAQDVGRQDAIDRPRESLEKLSAEVAAETVATTDAERAERSGERG